MIWSKLTLTESQ